MDLQTNSQYWFNVNFLGYGNDLRVVRKYNTSATDSVSGQFAQGGDFLSPRYNQSVQIKNEEDYENQIGILGTSGPGG